MTTNTGMNINLTTMTNIAISTNVASDINSYYNNVDISFAFYSDNTIQQIMNNNQDKAAGDIVCNHVATTQAYDTNGIVSNVIGDQYYNQALCENYSLAQQIKSISEESLGANVLYGDTKSLYSRELLMTINICIGIIGSGVFIYFNR